jgi:hypothetical protein
MRGEKDDMCRNEWVLLINTNKAISSSSSSPGPELLCRARKSDKDTEGITGYHLCTGGGKGER